MARIPKTIIVESEEDPALFTQLYPCYYNTITRAIALRRPTQDAAAPGATKRGQALTVVKSLHRPQKSPISPEKRPTNTWRGRSCGMPPARATRRAWPGCMRRGLMSTGATLTGRYVKKSPIKRALHAPEKGSVLPSKCACLRNYVVVTWLHHTVCTDIKRCNQHWQLAAPLHKASEHGHLDVVEALLGLGADAQLTNQLGWSALHYACFSGANLDVVAALLRRGLDVNSKTETGYTPLHMCAVKGNHRAMRLLVAAGADKNAREKYHHVNAAELVMMNSGLGFAEPGKSDLRQACLAALEPLPSDTRSKTQLEDELLII